jgi:hypothetical protein
MLTAFMFELCSNWKIKIFISLYKCISRVRILKKINGRFYLCALTTMSWTVVATWDIMAKQSTRLMKIKWTLNGTAVFDKPMINNTRCKITLHEPHLRSTDRWYANYFYRYANYCLQVCQLLFTGMPTTVYRYVNYCLQVCQPLLLVRGLNKKWKYKKK